MSGALERVYHASPAGMQGWLVSGYRYLRLPLDYGPRYRTWRGFLEQSQWWAREELERWQLRRLQALVAHAYANVPAYRRLYDEAGVRPEQIRSLDDLRRLPIVGKQAVRADPEGFLARGAARFKPVAMTTSGTTGSPFQFFSDAETEAIERAFYWRHRGWGSARHREPTISMGGKPVVPRSQARPPFWRYNRADRLLWLSTLHMTPERLDDYAEIVKRSGIRFVKGYPSNLSLFAHRLAERDLRLPMRAVFTGSEPLFDHARELIEDRFACKVFDWYGVSERVVTAGQCDRHAGYHLHMENCLVEIVRGGAPAGAGETGEVIGTCLSNYAMPLIRYRTGDLSRLLPGPCPCGRGLATIGPVQTKWEHVILTADRRWISPSALTHPFKPVRGIRTSQLVQESPGELTVRIAAEPAFDDEQRARLLEGFRQRLGPEMRLRIETVAEIPDEPSGKFRWVVSRVPSELNDLIDRQQRDGVGDG